MEGFCRGCLIRYDDPIELLQYTEKYRRLFVYSTGLQVKRNDIITFQVCKDCFLNMKAACKFKKQCRASDKKLKSYLTLKDVGEGLDFCTFIKNSDDTFRLPSMSGCSTPANQNYRDDDNESTCTSIRNFMTDILQGEEMPDTEARIVREVIEEEADVLDDSLDSHWLQDDASIDTDFRLDFSFSPFRTPHSVDNDHYYTPRSQTEQKEVKPKKYFTSISPKQHKIVNDYTDLIKNNLSEKELCVVESGDINIQESIDNNDITATKNGNSLNRVDLHIKVIDGKSLNNLNIPSIGSEKLINNLDLSVIDNIKSISSLDLPSIDNDESETSNTDLPVNHNTINNIDLSFFDSEKSMNNLDLPSLPSIDNDNDTSINNLDLSIDNVDQGKSLNIKNFYLPNDSDNNFISTSKEIENLVTSKLNVKKSDQDRPCTIDANLDKALQDENNTEIPLDDLLVTPRASSVASTPTIANILFGEKLDLNESGTNRKFKYMKKLENIKIEFEEFFDKNNKIKDIDRNVIKEPIDLKNDEFKVPMDVDEIDNLNLKAKVDKLKVPAENDEQFDLENYFCKLCNKKYKHEKALRIHFNKAHEIIILKAKKQSSESKPRVCSICAREFTNRSNFHRHLKRHKTASETSELKVKQNKTKASHKGITESNEEQFICTTCGARSTSKKNLRLHQKRHAKEYSHICVDCGKGFIRALELTLHMRTHTGEKPFSCELCHHKFARKDSLDKHIKWHMNDRPYKCEYCDVWCINRRQLNAHLKKSKKCKKKRGIVIDESDIETATNYEETEEDGDEEIEDEAELEEALKTAIAMKTQLPYIDTENSN